MSRANFSLRRALADLYKVYDIYEVIANYDHDKQPEVRRLQYQLKDIFAVLKDIIKEDTDVL